MQASASANAKRRLVLIRFHPYPGTLYSMAALARPALAIAAIALATFYLLPAAVSAGFSIHFPLFHRSHDNWTQFRNGPDNNAVIPGKLETSWRVETGGQISASPTLVGGTLY